MLTLEDIEHFKRNGFLILRGLYTETKMAEMRRWIDELAACTPAPGKEMVYFEDSLTQPGQRILSRIEKFADAGMPFFGVIQDRQLLDIVDALQGGPSVLFKEKINFKIPGSGGFEPHQDIQPGWDDYAPYFVSVAIAVDDNTLENGCLELAAGHHQRGWIGERMKPLTSEQLTGIVFKPCPMQAGDVAFLDVYAPHRSAANQTDSPPRNLYLTYNRKSDGDHRDRYFADKRRNYPPDNERVAGKAYAYNV